MRTRLIEIHRSLIKEKDDTYIINSTSEVTEFSFESYSLLELVLTLIKKVTDLS